MPTDLAKLRELEKQATPAPWRGDRHDGTVKYQILAGPEPVPEHLADWPVVCTGDNGNNAFGPYGFHREEDEAFVMALRNAAPALLDELARLRATVAAVERAEMEMRAAAQDSRLPSSAQAQLLWSADLLAAALKTGEGK